MTKYRHPCFTILRLETICREQYAGRGIELLEFGGEADRVHILLDMHPNIMPNRFINNLKTVTSRLVRKELNANKRYPSPPKRYAFWMENSAYIKEWLNKMIHTE